MWFRSTPFIFVLLALLFLSGEVSAQDSDGKKTLLTLSTIVLGAGVGFAIAAGIVIKANQKPRLKTREDVGFILSTLAAWLMTAWVFLHMAQTATTVA